MVNLVQKHLEQISEFTNYYSFLIEVDLLQLLVFPRLFVSKFSAEESIKIDYGITKVVNGDVYMTNVAIIIETDFVAIL